MVKPYEAISLKLPDELLSESDRLAEGLDMVFAALCLSTLAKPFSHRE